MNRALTLLTLVCGLALTVPASAATVKTTKPATTSTMQSGHVIRVHHKRVAHKRTFKRAERVVKHSARRASKGTATRGTSTK